VVLELDDKIVQSEIDFRYDLPEKKVILTLDSEKTYRIFENLIINITKYAMPHTRAYIDMKLKGDSVVVTLKNVSDAELNINAQEISERFVRGDVSRNTEGSGLGLAIVKSFVELQDGKLQIIADGDLFKVMIEWKIPRI
jgi:signal transduction histidine kinase